MNGRNRLSFDTLPENVENLRAGRLRAYAITATTRAPSVPEVPTVAEAGLPPAVTARLHAETAAMQTSMVQERLATVGIIGGTMTQPDFTNFVASQIDTMGGTVRAMGIRND
jgi:tripartite-type tricarboxylate transporter receptor subunit TctC